MKKVIIISIIFLLTSCGKNSGRQNNNSTTITIDIDKPSLNSKIFNNLEMIKIQGGPVGKIRKLYPINDDYVFSVASGKDRAYLFKPSNDSLIPLIAKGDGPEEVVDVTSLYVDALNHINIQDMIRKKLYIIDATSLSKEEVVLPDFFDEITSLNSSTFVGYKKVPYNEKDYKITTFQKDDNGNFKTIFENFTISNHLEERDFAQQKAIYNYKDSIRFTQPFSDTIYTINSNTVSAKYIIDFLDKELPYKLYNNKNLDLMQFVQKLRKNNYIWNISSVLENKAYVFLSYRYGAEPDPYFSIYNKLTTQTTTFKNLNLQDMIAIKPSGFNEDFYPVHMDDDAFYVIAEPYFLIENNITSYKEHSISYEDNPFILKLSFANDDNQ